MKVTFHMAYDSWKLHALYTVDSQLNDHVNPNLRLVYLNI